MSNHRWVKGAKRVPNKIAVGDKLYMKLDIEVSLIEYDCVVTRVWGNGNFMLKAEHPPTEEVQEYKFDKTGYVLNVGTRKRKAQITRIP